ncbi:MAG: hypothetical protein EBS39_01785, partial [Gammaproteobacteria bacterium]|nr:hypothetical protein [Gammaproteobacteria bacterium]
MSTSTPDHDAATAGVPRTPDTSRIVGIDGLRALAVLGVMAFHADWLVAQGGFFGVDLFFVISGFLITRLLLAELERSGTISFRGFYLRRARRILPAMATAIAGAAIAAVVLAPDALPMLRADALASVLFVTNWHFIFQELSYFEYIGRQPLLQHLWSLAIEEQFYLLWPLVVLALASRGGRRMLGAVAVAAAVVSCIWMGWLADRLGFPESMAIGRVYFGTDTHAMGLLAGAALAAAAPAISAWARPGEGTGEGLRRSGALLGIAGLAGTAVLFSQVGENHPWLYPWAFAASALFSAAMIVACLMPGPFGRALDLQPLRWIGERSYGIYLWHWPVFMLTRPGVDNGLDDGQAFVLRCALTFAAAAASYRFIEAPILGRTLRPMAVTPQFARGALAALVCAALFVLMPLPRGSEAPTAGPATGAATAPSAVQPPSVAGRPGAPPVVGTVVQGPRRFELVVRLAESASQDPATLGNLLIPTMHGELVPLSRVATIRVDSGPAQVSREHVQRRIVVESNIRGRDLGGFVAEAQAVVAQTVALPPGYELLWGGQFEHLKDASRRLAIVIPITLLLILGVLTVIFGAMRPALLIFLNVPLALSGGILALWARGLPLSMSAVIGFIALFGIAVLNGVVLVSHIRQLESESRSADEAVTEGAMDRLRPVLMTALVASLGFVPMALATSMGAEVQRPLATVVIG